MLCIPLEAYWLKLDIIISQGVPLKPLRELKIKTTEIFGSIFFKNANNALKQRRIPLDILYQNLHLARGDIKVINTNVLRCCF